MSYIIQQTYNENAKNNQVEVVILFQHEILVTNLQGGGGGESQQSDPRSLKVTKERQVLNLQLLYGQDV